MVFLSWMVWGIFFGFFIVLAGVVGVDGLNDIRKDVLL